MSLPRSKRHVAFAALIVATVIAVLDISAVNLALPTIAQSLGLSLSDVLWLSKANLLACAISILPCSALGDVFGHRRVFCVGLLTFAVSAAGCAIGSSLWVLISLRTLQGCASAAIMCSSLVLLREIFPRKMIGTALGLNALFVAIATTTGPAISGLVLALLSWRWLFSIGPVLALVAFVIGLIHLPEKRLENSELDLVGTLMLVGSALALLGWYLGFGDVWLPILAILMAGIFFNHQRHTKWPLLPLMLFENLRFDYALGASVIAFIGQSSVYIALPLVFQQLMGHSPLAAALLFMPWPLMTALIGPWAGRRADQNNPRIVASVGIAIFAFGLAALATLPSHAHALDIMWRTAICGIGFGLFQSPNNREILTNVLPLHAARAAALLSAARLTGQAMGAVLVGIILSQAQPSHAILRVAERSVVELLWYTCLLQVCLLAIGACAWGINGRRSSSAI